jgi:methylenetetrahydrofolate reductase (NADPH)
MPPQTYASFMRLTKLTGVHVPEEVRKRLEEVKGDDREVKEYGVELCTRMIKEIVKETKGEIRGFNFCTLNLERSVVRILEGLGWTGQGADGGRHNQLIADAPAPPPQGIQRAKSSDSTTSSDLIVSPSSATTTATHHLSSSIPKPTAQGEAGSGELNAFATWDEFPNGRFGDFKSPAFGESDQWGGPAGALRHQQEGVVAQWGRPKSVQDLTTLFLAHLRGEIETTPFSGDTLSPESATILGHLEKLTQMGWWTVGSQPAVDGVPSDHPIFGWGPRRGGYVFQKSFVEFFCKQEDVVKIEKLIEREGQGWVQWFAGNAKGDVRSNVPEGGRNAVTWGVFAGQEIAQTTIIERESFLSWKVCLSFSNLSLKNNVSYRRRHSASGLTGHHFMRRRARRGGCLRESEIVGGWLASFITITGPQRDCGTS